MNDYQNDLVLIFRSRDEKGNGYELLTKRFILVKKRFL